VVGAEQQLAGGKGYSNVGLSTASVATIGYGKGNWLGELLVGLGAGHGVLLTNASISP
jgi:hypothetical protein